MVCGVEPRVDRVEHRAVIGTPKCASSIAGTFGSMADTVSPGPTPRRASAEASRRHRSRNSR